MIKKKRKTVIILLILLLVWDIDWFSSMVLLCVLIFSFLYYQKTYLSRWADLSMFRIYLGWLLNLINGHYRWTTQTTIPSNTYIGPHLSRDYLIISIKLQHSTLPYLFIYILFTFSTNPRMQNCVQVKKINLRPAKTQENDNFR